MKTSAKFLVSLLTLALGSLALLMAFINSAHGQFITAVPGQPQYQQGPTFQAGTSENSWNSRTTIIRSPAVGMLAPIGYSRAFPNDAVRQHSLSRTGNGENYHESVQRIEDTQRVIVQDPFTGRRELFFVQSQTVVKTKSEFQTTPYFPTTVQVAVAKDAPRHGTVYGPTAGKRGHR